MNARKVLCAVCVLVVGLLLESSVLAGPPSVLYWLGERPVYGPSGGPVAPRVGVPLYRAENSKRPGFLGGRSSVPLAEPPAARYESWNDLLYGYDLPLNEVPVAPKWSYQWSDQWSDPLQPGGWDPWDPLGNSFGFAK